MSADNAVIMRATIVSSIVSHGDDSDRATKAGFKVVDYSAANPVGGFALVLGTEIQRERYRSGVK
jgi:hypothetical protein